jgi:hypothetical protein
VVSFAPIGCVRTHGTRWIQLIIIMIPVFLSILFIRAYSQTVQPRRRSDHDLTVRPQISIDVHLHRRWYRYGQFVINRFVRKQRFERLIQFYFRKRDDHCPPRVDVFTKRSRDSRYYMAMFQYNFSLLLDRPLPQRPLVTLG